MKNSHAISIVFISIVIIIIITTFGDASTYVSFSEARSMYNIGNSSKIHVVGQLNKNENNEIQGLMNSKNKLSFSFDMIDENGKIEYRGKWAKEERDLMEQQGYNDGDKISGKMFPQLWSK